MNASLPMYMRAETLDAHNIYWQLIRDELASRGVDAPVKLDHPQDLYDSWRATDLVLSQTCGLPYNTTLRDQVNLVGTPDYQLEGCPPGYYRSAVVVHQSRGDKALSDFQSGTLVYNSDDSQSGYNAALQYFKPLGFWFKNSRATTAHQISAREVAEQTADIAVIDAMTLQLLNKYEDFSKELHIVDWTQPTPGTPYITSLQHDPEVVFTAIATAISKLPTDAKAVLHLNGIVKIPATAYRDIPNPSV